MRARRTSGNLPSPGSRLAALTRHDPITRGEDMGIEDMVNKAKEALGGDAKVDEAVDQAADAVKEKAPDQADPIIDQAAQAAKDAL
jgi:uncharacterized protein (DUF1786 family)